MTFSSAIELVSKSTAQGSNDFDGLLGMNKPHEMAESPKNLELVTMNWLGGWATRLKNMKVIQDSYSLYMETNGKPKMFQTTNQMGNDVK